MSDFGTHWCYTCWRFVTIDGDVVCPLCNGSFIQDPNDMDNPWGAIREAASRGIDEIFNLEDYIHALMRNDTVDSSDDEEPWMDDTSDSEVEDDQIDYNSNCPALPSDSLKTVRITQMHVQDDLNCSICLDQFQLDHEVRETPCKHLYHHDCIILWLAWHESCPICRFDMRPRPTWWQYAFPFLWRRSRRRILLWWANTSWFLFYFLYYLISSPINLITILASCVIFLCL